MAKRLLVLSVDAMVTEDVDAIRSMPNFRKYLAGGSEFRGGMRTIYPSVTYPIHVSILTGCYAGKHQITSNFKFYAVFQENEEYSVRSESQEIGTLVAPPPAGEKIAIAGHVWVVDEVDRKRHIVYCTMVKGKVPAYFGDVPGDINTVILERMRQVLIEPPDTIYPYLMHNAVARLRQARVDAAVMGLADRPLRHLGGNMWALFPWLGTYAFLALKRLLLLRCAPVLGLKGMEACSPYYMTFRMEADAATFYRAVATAARDLGDPLTLMYPDEVPDFNKYDRFLPPQRVRKGFACGVLDIDGMRARVREWERFVSEP